MKIGILFLSIFSPFFAPVLVVFILALMSSFIFIPMGFLIGVLVHFLYGAGQFPFAIVIGLSISFLVFIAQKIKNRYFFENFNLTA